MRSSLTLRPLHFAVIPVALLAALPLLVVLSFLLQPDAEIWAHLSRYVLPSVLLNTLLLLLGVLCGVLVLGVVLAWLVSQYDFPGRGFFSWALMLPLAMPAYVMAFVQVGLLDFTGPVQTLLRAVDLGFMNLQGLRLPQIRSTGGAVLVLSLAFYPYVYLLARNAFSTMGRRAMEVGQSLGYSPWQSLWRVALPLARPWLMAGALLALMETLADFGAVYILGVDTFTTAIYKAWFGMFSLAAAAQLASLLILLAFVLMVLEQWHRGMRRYQVQNQAAQRKALQGRVAFAASAICTLVWLAAFLVPVLQLLYWVCSYGWQDIDSRYLGFIWHSISLAGLAGVAVLLFAFLIAGSEYHLKDRLARICASVATVGYAVPGAVLAVGVFIPVAALDNFLVKHFGLSSEWLLKGSVISLIVALMCRFLSVAVSPLRAAFERISPNLITASHSMGVYGKQLWWRVYLPLLKGGSASAFLLVFIDVMKEMPITLMMRPFGWDTLSIRIFEMTSEGEWERAALPALILLLSGLLPVFLLIRNDEAKTSRS